jgi:predicted esterase
MTKENRIMDIENYVEYLNILYHREVGSTNTIPVTILGFSQGCATASRWVTDGKIKFQRLILWAGVFPPDMNFEKSHTLKGKETFLVYGKSDPFINDSRFAEMKSISSTLGIEPALVEFEGRHDIDSKTLLKFT